MHHPLVVLVLEHQTHIEAVWALALPGLDAFVESPVESVDVAPCIERQGDVHIGDVERRLVDDPQLQAFAVERVAAEGLRDFVEFLDQGGIRHDRLDCGDAHTGARRTKVCLRNALLDVFH